MYIRLQIMKREIYNMPFRVYRKLRFYAGFVRSFIMGRFMQKEFRDIRFFCLFIGYPRSGHSLVAALLDAHHEMVISMEWDAMLHMKMGYKRRQIFFSIIHNSRAFRRREKNIWTGYSYRIENSWQGKYSRLRIIGDKKGGRTSLMLKNEPQLLNGLMKRVSLPLKILHVIRNPFDNITTMARRSIEESGQDDPGTLTWQLNKAISSYFDRVETNSGLISKGGCEIMNIYHEDLVRDPAGEVEKIIRFLELDIPENYIGQCTSIVYKKPHRSREKIRWPEELIVKVENEIQKYPFLRRYSYHS